MPHRDVSLTAYQLRFQPVLCLFIAILLSLFATVTRGVERRVLYTSSHGLYLMEWVPPYQDGKESRKLELGKPIERELAGGESHSYEFTVPQNQYLHLVIDQRGIDVVIALFGPNGNKLEEVDSPTGTSGAETLMVVVEAAGSYRLDVYSPKKDSAPGRYEIKFETLRPATEQDTLRVPALRVFMEAELLRAERTTDSTYRAISKYEVALAAFRGAKDRSGEGMVTVSIATAYRDLHDTRKAFEFFDRGVAIFQAAGDRGGEAHTINDIGVFYMSMGDYQMALNCFRQALPIFQSLGDRSKEARTLRIIGELYGETGERKKAIAYYNQALPLFHELGDKHREAFTLYHIGFAYRMSGEAQPALEYLNRAYSLYQFLGDRAGEAEALIEIAFTDVWVKETQKALELFAKVRQIFKEINDIEGEAYVLDGVGIAYREMGEHQKAIEYFNQALSIWRAVGNGSGESMTLYQVARSERANGNLLTALSHVEAVLKDIEAKRIKINNQELRASYSAQQYEPYEFAISLRMQLHKQKPLDGHDALALQVSERTRARSLLELLTEAHVNIRQDVDPRLLERERVLQQLLTGKAEDLMLLRSNATHNRADERLTNEIMAVEKQIEAVTLEHQQVQAQIRANSPRSASLTQPQALGLKGIQQLLDPETLLLEYALGEERSYLWAVSSTTLQSYELPGRAEVEGVAKRVYQALTARSRRPADETADARRARIEKADADYPAAALALSEMILKDVGAHLGNKRLVIVSDGVLQYIPFAALPQPASTNTGRTVTSPPLLVNHEIVNLPSASTLAMLRQYVSGRRPAAKVVAIIADPVFEKGDIRVKTLGAGLKSTTTQSKSSSRVVVARDFERAMEDVNGGARFPPLRLAGAHWEAEEISKLVSAKERMRALDFAANRQTATSPGLSQYRIVHFATHAFNNSAHPELSGIVLSLVNERGEPQDGFLRLGEIFNLNLPVELVVLSGCQTGLGKDVKGEGLIGLTRGFMYSGAPRMIVSLWSVDDRATAALMARFYKRMLGEQRQSPSAALRGAQIDMWKESGRKAPYFWAGFVFQGEWKQMGAN